MNRDIIKKDVTFHKTECRSVLQTEHARGEVVEFPSPYRLAYARK